MSESRATDALDERAYKGLVELMKDAESCIRLTDWEEAFCSDMRDKLLQYKQKARVSPAQWVILEKIEAKVYAV